MKTTVLKKSLNSAAGKALKDRLIGKLFELRDIESIKEKGTATEQALETKAQRRAYFKLKEILSEFIDIEAEVKEKDPRDSFAIE